MAKRTYNSFRMRGVIVPTTRRFGGAGAVGGVTVSDIDFDLNSSWQRAISTRNTAHKCCYRESKEEGVSSSRELRRAFENLPMSGQGGIIDMSRLQAFARRCFAICGDEAENRVVRIEFDFKRCRLHRRERDLPTLRTGTFWRRHIPNWC